MNKEGESWSIEYLHWDNSRWVAKLGPICAFKINNAVVKAIDPVFQHIRAGTSVVDHEDPRIGYITGGGGQWSSECYAHSTPFGDVSFTFGHFRSTSMDHKDHEDGTIVFMDWDRSLWVATIKPISDVRDTNYSPFILRR